MLLIGLVVLSSYFFNFLYVAISYPLSWLLVAEYLILLAGIPLLMIFLLIGYFRPEKGKVKNTMLAIFVVAAFFFVVFSYLFADALYVVLSMASDNTGFYYSVWGLGGTILTAAGFSMQHNKEESTSPGIMDVSALQYYVAPEPEPEVEETSEAEVVTPEVETSSEETKPVAEDEKPESE
jgi:hypothetical protein